MPNFNIETPFENTVSSPFVLSGWVIPPVKDLDLVWEINIFLNDRNIAKTLVNKFRDDVYAKYGFSNAGFASEILVDNYIDKKIVLDILLLCKKIKYRKLIKRLNLKVNDSQQKERYKKMIDISIILQCPYCRSDKIHTTKNKCTCKNCCTSNLIRRGAYIFSQNINDVSLKLLETNATNEYSIEVLNLIRNNENKLILDFGGGNPLPKNLFNNVILHDVVQYSNTDVISTTDNLPYKNNSFDFIISQAVFEHVRRPWETARELYRILKPGGQIFIDTAFMQPYHADPNHYFNMTLNGVREIFHMFKEIKCYVKDYQLPSYGIKMQFNTILPYIKNKWWQEYLNNFIHNLDRHSFDVSLNPVAINIMAAGVCFIGEK